MLAKQQFPTSTPIPAPRLQVVGTPDAHQPPATRDTDHPTDQELLSELEAVAVLSEN